MNIGYVSLEGRGATDACIAQAVARLESAGVRLAGTVQTNPERAKSHICDMDLRVLPDGPVLRISQNLGAHARGCRLDGGALEQAVMETHSRLGAAQVLIVNKFGKQEAEGRGFVPLIAEAVARDIPVLLGVNGLNLGAFLAFSGGFANALPSDAAAVADWALSAVCEDA